MGESTLVRGLECQGALNKEMGKWERVDREKYAEKEGGKRGNE